METNYEALGRCKKLSQEIETLKATRQRAFVDLRGQLAASGNPPIMSSTVITFNADEAYKKLKTLEATDIELMQAISEYNEWAPQADERLIALKAPRES
ncbi:hypothetical protein SAMN04487867_104170 [Vreelandella titanicae]|uniref:hypothetical protein n=1 Tax=Vreelandella titanicae TaxID=664683 RepID=UPI000886F50B|nr:hypothetical protein [Halomonas titanicae]SDI30063.1 hypothetical protein SAMN04487867_104170 [Halomonas titanicae]